MTEFTVIGDINIDIVPEPIPVDKNVKEDGQYFVDDLAYRRGGQAANFAVQVSQLGDEVYFQGKVGDDNNAEFLKEHLQQSGVETNLNFSNEVRTGTTVVIPWENGERYFITHHENNAQLSTEDIDLQQATQHDHLARRGVWFSKPMLNGGNKKLLKKAKEEGLETSIDLHWDPYWDRTGNSDGRRQKFIDCLEHADILMGNQEEIKMLTKKDRLDPALEKLGRKGADIIVVHQGSEGSTVWRDGDTKKIGTDKVENPVNPTGTGDSYDAGFLHSWTSDRDLEEAAREATRVAVDHLTGDLS